MNTLGRNRVEFLFAISWKMVSMFPLKMGIKFANKSPEVFSATYDNGNLIVVIFLFQGHKYVCVCVWIWPTLDNDWKTLKLLSWLVDTWLRLVCFVALALTQNKGKQELVLAFHLLLCCLEYIIRLTPSFQLCSPFGNFILCVTTIVVVGIIIIVTPIIFIIKISINQTTCIVSLICELTWKLQVALKNLSWILSFI